MQRGLFDPEPKPRPEIQVDIERIYGPDGQYIGTLLRSPLYGGKWKPAGFEAPTIADFEAAVDQLIRLRTARDEYQRKVNG